MSAEPVRVAILGAGVRGREHSRYIRRHGGRIAAIAEPVEERRRALAAEHDVPADACFTDWRALAEQPGRVDAVVITTQDNDHAEARTWTTYGPPPRTWTGVAQCT